VVYLTLDDILESHQNQIDTYGGSHGIRDFGLLESAIAQPESSFGGQYLHADIFEMAGDYLYHCVMTHPFVDGNPQRQSLSYAVPGPLSRLESQSSPAPRIRNPTAAITPMLASATVPVLVPVVVPVQSDPQGVSRGFPGVEPAASATLLTCSTGCYGFV
jgi:hypothetical protein